MSDNDTNVTVEGEIDAGFTSYWDSDEHGQTVGGTTEDDKGSVETDIWPDEVDPEDLTEKQKRAISTAVKNPLLSLREVAKRSGVSTSTVERSLKKNASGWYNKKFKNTGKSAKENSGPSHAAPGENQEKILTIINNSDGVSRKELAARLNVNADTVKDHIGKIDNSEYEVKRGVGGYHHRAKVYYPPESDEGTDQPNQSENSDKRERAPPKATLTTKSINGGDYYYWQWRQNGEVKSEYIGPVDKVDPDSLDRSGNQEPESQETDVQEILGVLKKTAVHQETKQALDVLEGYL